jgi:hypothetical protein
MKNAALLRVAFSKINNSFSATHTKRPWSFESFCSNPPGKVRELRFYIFAMADFKSKKLLKVFLFYGKHIYGRIFLKKKRRKPVLF